ncbi:hypothetical protein Bbelb_151270, partial [Branchiostoma belcheri]
MATRVARWEREGRRVLGILRALRRVACSLIIGNFSRRVLLVSAKPSLRGKNSLGSKSSLAAAYYSRRPEKKIRRRPTRLRRRLVVGPPGSVLRPETDTLVGQVVCYIWHPSSLMTAETLTQSQTLTLQITHASTKDGESVEEMPLFFSDVWMEMCQWGQCGAATRGVGVTPEGRDVKSSRLKKLKCRDDLGAGTCKGGSRTAVIRPAVLKDQADRSSVAYVRAHSLEGPGAPRRIDLVFSCAPAGQS